MISVLLLLMTQAPPPPSDAESELFPDLGQPPLTATISPAGIGGEQKVTLNELLEAAEKQNVDRRISAEQHRRAEKQLTQAWTGLLPALSVNGAWVHNQFESEIPAGAIGNPEPITLSSIDQLDIAARVDLPLIDTQRWMRTAITSAVSDSAAERERLTLDQVKRAVASGWYMYAAALALRASADRSVSLSEAQRKLQEIRERTGTATELELMRARAEVDRNRQSVADAVRMIGIARRNLVSLTGLDPGDVARLPQVDLRAPAPLEEMEANVGALPAVRAAQEDLRTAEKYSTAAKLAVVPNLSAQFTERFTSAGGFTGEAFSYNFGLNLGWRIDVPTFVEMSVQSSNVALAELAVEKAEIQARDLINADWQTLQAALVKVTAAKAQVDAARRARAVAAARYQVGASTQIDVIQADRDLFGAEVLEIQAQSDLASARVALQISAGLPIEVP